MWKMCNIVETLVREDDFRNITQCEHGTVHLNWYRASLHMPAQDFMKVVSFLEDSANEDRDTLRDEVGLMKRDERGRVQLWLMGMGLYLDSADFLLLVDLTRQAVRKLEVPQLKKLEFILPLQQAKSTPPLFEMFKQSSPMFSEN
jgi:hypothetical protein